MTYYEVENIYICLYIYKNCEREWVMIQILMVNIINRIWNERLYS